MPEKIVEKLGEAASRRSFLGKLSAAAAALVMSLLNVRTVHALVPVGCCQLCVDPRTCTYGPCVCEWSWTCVNEEPNLSCRRYTCRECYSALPAPCNAGCLAVTCSRATYMTVPCERPRIEPPKKK